MQNRTQGFSLTELLVVIGIIAVVIAIVLPTLSRVREGANRVKCASNLRQIGVQLLLYANDNRNNLPRTRYTPGATPSFYTGSTDGNPFAGTSTVAVNDQTAAMFLLLRTYDFNAGVFICPSSGDKADGFSGGPTNPVSRANFVSNENLSYSLAYPYPDAAAVAAGYRWTRNQ
jgi:prepilin-type N-terminal cleavage/methylation domain-containing protein